MRARPEGRDVVGADAARRACAGRSRSLGARVFDKYGSREFSGIAYQCEAGEALHVMDESYVVELLVEGRPARPGEVGEVVVTDLNNFSVPLIRYRIGDLADRGRRSESPVRAARTLSRIGEIQGRTQAIVHCADGTWLPGTFFAHFFKEYDHVVRFFQVVQEERGAFALRVVKGDQFSSAGFDELMTALREYIVDTKVDVEFVDEIPLGANGQEVTGACRPCPATSRTPHRKASRWGRASGRPHRCPHTKRRYSYCNAPRTSSLAARRAGATAARIPAATATIAKTTTVPTGSEKLTPYFESAWIDSAPRPIPSGSPSAAPISAVITLSWRIIRRVCRLVMPTARSIPSSRVRSNTDRTSVLTMPKSDTITLNASRT